MDLVSFSVEKYRSITSAYRLRLGRLTILVGPNNEGKSNILRALVTAMNVLTVGREIPTEHMSRARFMGRLAYRRYYDWQTDFPRHLQKRTTAGQSVMILEFRLTEEETSEFRKIIKSSLNGTLPIKIALGPQDVAVSVAKQGKGAKALSAKSDRIARFVAERLDFEHIQAVRTAQAAEEVVNDMVERELQKLETIPEYKAALAQIEAIQKPLLDQLSVSIRETLVEFLPAVRDVTVQVRSSDRYRALRRSCEIVVDDGTPTPLQYKGDGVQSLASLGIMRHASERGARGRNIVIAIEEPESHLHPNAIHGLRQVIYELSQKHQVVLTTHCPLFVDRTNIRSNIIVYRKRARSARSVEEIRDILGVRASDNLRHAELVLVVEGESDRTAVGALLRAHSSLLGGALSEGAMAIDTLGGGSNLSYKVGLIQEALCSTHCFLDDDKAAKDAFEKAHGQGLVADADVNFSTCEGMAEAEIEDLLDPGIYESLVKDHYGVSLETARFRSSKKKWTERMREVFKQQGKTLNERIENELKAKIADAVALNPSVALNPHRKPAFEALVRNLEGRLTRTR